MVVFFKGPKSFTGEDVAELHIHSSVAVISTLCRYLGSIAGLRLAEPGEFTRRAFLNGKIGLLQVEGLADLLASETDAQRRLALQQMDGQTGKKFHEWRRELIRAMAMTEAWIDFSEDENIEEDTLLRIREAILELVSDIKGHIQGQQLHEIVRNGMHIALCGPPNSGKSSILNCLVSRDASIVSPIAGTTRDVLQVNLEVEGIPVILYDTAGIRETTDDVIEKEGIKRALQTANSVDYILFAIDASDGTFNSTLQALLQLNPRNLTIILNKIDLKVKTLSPESIRKALPPSHQNVSIIENSCINPRNSLIRPYLSSLVDQLQFQFTKQHSALVTERQRQLAQAALLELQSFLHETDIVVAAEGLRRAISAIGKISGEVGTEEILDVLFSSFCIGK